MRFWFEFFKDNRFNFRFKIANLIMGDELRECLAFSYARLTSMMGNDELTNLQKKKISNTVDDISYLMFD